MKKDSKQAVPEIPQVHKKLTNRLICGAKCIKYKLTEPILLRIMRSLHQGKYENIEESPLVSVIIATYNRGRILVERTLPSIFSQSYQNFEVVIVGDHCPDNTPELLAKMKDPRVRFYNLTKRGKYPASPELRWFVQGTVPRNKALQLARGKWFSWISDDDILLPNHIESLLKFAQKGNYEFVSAAYITKKHGKEFVVDVKGVEPRIGGMQTWLYRSYLRFFKWNKDSWRKSWNRPTDYDLQHRMYNAGVRMGFLDEVVAYVPPVEGTDTVGLEAQKYLAEKERENGS